MSAGVVTGWTRRVTSTASGGTTTPRLSGTGRTNGNIATTRFALSTKIKPYDRFLTEQLAGDELVDWRAAETLTPEMKELLVATGFLRVAADDTSQYELNTMDIRYDVLHRTLRTVTSNLLGLTMMCAQCHNHKYDPIPQRDYYRMAAVFMPAFNPNQWLQPEDRLLADVSPTKREKIDQENLRLDRRVEPLKRKLATVHRPYHLRLLEEKLAQLPENLREDVKTAVLTPDTERTAIQEYLMEKLGVLVDVPVEEISVLLSQEEGKRANDLDRQISQLEESRRSYGRIHAVYDTGPPPTSHLLRRGDYQNPGRQVKPGFLEVLTDLDQPQVIEDGAPANGSSERRLALAPVAHRQTISGRGALGSGESQPRVAAFVRRGYRCYFRQLWPQWCASDPP